MAFDQILISKALTIAPSASRRSAFDLTSRTSSELHEHDRQGRRLAVEGGKG
jgi:hypothetical protein